MQFLVVTHDAPMQEVFRHVLAEMNAAVEFRGDATSGRASLEEQRFDVVAIDCDDLYQGSSLLHAAHASRPNKSSLVLAITSGETSAADAVDLGAQLVAAKPLPPDRARFELRRACQALASGQPRKRYPVRLPVFLSFGQVLDRRAEAFNLSLGGLGLRMRDPMEEDDIVHLRFWLPECSTPIQARGEIAWSDRQGNAGLRFISMSQHSLSHLARWLQRLALTTSSPRDRESALAASEANSPCGHCYAARS
jgi:CheY-like chemotaxis protein